MGKSATESQLPIGCGEDATRATPGHVGRIDRGSAMRMLKLRFQISLITLPAASQCTAAPSLTHACVLYTLYHSIRVVAHCSPYLTGSLLRLPQCLLSISIVIRCHVFPNLHFKMLLSKSLPLSLLLALNAVAQVTLTGTNGASSDGGTALPTATYIIYDSTSKVLSTSTATNATIGGPFSSMAAANASSGSTTASSTSASVTYLVGGQGSSSTSMSGTAMRNATSTSSSAQPTNTQPCNGHPQFCNRKFSNITMVAAHNSPFVRPENAASNQVLGVTTQLNDGIRMRKWLS
jgi:hypothetical protein